MPRERIEGLISELHDKFANSDTSPEQDRMIARMQSELEEWRGPKPPADGDLKEAAERLLEDIEELHPKASMVVREIIQTLAGIGL